MLCIPITGPSLIEASHQISESQPLGDLFELRLDLLDHFSMENLSNLRKEIQKPLIFTLRKKQQGGNYRGSEEERLQEIGRLAQLSPTYFDLEYDISHHFAKEMAAKFPEIKFIISYHDFTHTPADLESLLKQLRTLPAHLYKIACHARTTNDSLRMLDLVRRNAPLLGMCMGERGEVTRLLAPIVGSPWIFAYHAPQQKTAPGQLSAEELRFPYAAPSFDRGSAIYGLIGGSVANSISHFTHNQVMRTFHLNAIYVKMGVERRELSTFFSLAKQMGIQGLSVTMPLKEEVIPFLDHLDPYAEKIGAVNTLLFQKGKWIGFNTDGKGALDAIEAKIKVRGKKVVILGAGGAARAISYEAAARGAHVCLLNRTQERAIRLAKEFKMEGGGLNRIEKEGYDLLINTTPNPLPIPKEMIRPYTFIMDIKTFPKMTPFLEEAKKKKCHLIFGYEMFIRQAVEQFHIWFDGQFDKEQVQKVLCDSCLT
jgi:3-dehydroquinate dehydratase / shikimate dehydrogenase